MKTFLIATTLALSALAATPAFAGGTHISLGFFAPAPVVYAAPPPVYYAPPVAYYPPVQNVYYAPPLYPRAYYPRQRVIVSAWNAPRYGYWRGRY